MTDVVGGYEIGERIAVGGMAEVFIALSRDRTRPVVVKRMLPQLEHSPDHVAMFVDEARLGAMLHHPHIVHVLDAGTDKGSHYMVLEYIDGPDLGQILKTARDANAPLPLHLAVWLIARAAEGLHHAHAARDSRDANGAPLGLVHRDVSPQNILVSRQGDVKVADFGVAKSDAQLHETKSGVVKGKVPYMSPEQLAGHTLDARADVLALGVCLWETLTHKRLYSGMSEVEVMRKVCFEMPVAPSLANARVPPALDAICMKALARMRSARYESAGAMMSALDAWSAANTPGRGRDELAVWMKARFHPRSVVNEAATGWQYKSPPNILNGISHGISNGTATVIATEATAPETPAASTPGKLKPLSTKRPVRNPDRKRDLVLYVEDEHHNWEVAELRLQRNYELLHAPDDKTACELLRTRGAQLNAILMDIQLKGSQLDGIALVKLIRGRLPASEIPEHARGVPTLSSVPIFFVTAYANRYPEAELLAVGADQLVTKPVDFAQLTLALTSVHLKKVVRL